MATTAPKRIIAEANYIRTGGLPGLVSRLKKQGLTMLYEIATAVPHPDHTVTITWADGARGVVDFTPFIERGELFTALQEPDYFVREMSILQGGIGLAWPNELDF